MRVESSKSYNYVIDRQSAKRQEKLIPADIVDLLVKKQQLAENAKPDQLKEEKACLETLNQQLEVSGKQTKEEKEKLKVLSTCLEISRRIISGDIVPQQDHRYLREHDPDLYARSISMRFPKNNPHEYKQLSNEEERKNNLDSGIANVAEALEEPITSEASVQETSGSVFDIKA